MLVQLQSNNLPLLAYQIRERTVVIIVIMICFLKLRYTKAVDEATEFSFFYDEAVMMNGLLTRESKISQSELVVVTSLSHDLIISLSLGWRLDVIHRPSGGNHSLFTQY